MKPQGEKEEDFYKINKVMELHSNGFTLSEILEAVNKEPYYFNIGSISTLHLLLKKGYKEGFKYSIGDTKPNIKSIVYTELKSYLSRYKLAFYGQRDVNGLWITRPNPQAAENIRAGYISFLEKCGIDFNIFGDKLKDEEKEFLVTSIVREVIPIQESKEKPN